ncbi:MAG: ABC transporter permease, partial [Anaerolineaceae bacterium]
MNVSSAFQLPVSFMIWGLLFFLAGYFLYASLMAGIGALVPNLREASQTTFIVIMPLILPLMLINVLINQPNGAISVFLSMFPFTSPVVMMTRISATQVPFWQIAIALALSVTTALITMKIISNFFRSQTLISGQKYSTKLFFKALVGIM